MNAINQCQYQAYLQYVEKRKSETNVWAFLGDKIHCALESCVKDGVPESCIQKAVNDGISEMEIIGLAFPKTKNGENLIGNHWIQNIERFAKEFKTPSGKFETEQLILYPVRDNIWMRGYVDAIRYNKDGTLWIIDWKTSSNFDKNHLKEAGRQLVLYSLAKMREGYNIKKASWVMLKYCVVSYHLKNGKLKEKVCEWRNCVSGVKTQIQKELNEAGYSECEADLYLNKAIKNNTFLELPDEVASKFSAKIYVRDYELTQERIDECLEYINKSINLFETLEKSGNWKPRNIEKDDFFCNCLCGFHSSCPYLQDYLAAKEAMPTIDEGFF